MNYFDSYIKERKNYIYYKVICDILEILSKDNNSIIDVGSCKIDLMSQFDFKERVSVSQVGAINNSLVKGYEMDFFDFKNENKFDVVTCFQVLEHVENVEEFTSKLLKTGKIAVISLPYKWRQTTCVSHIHDPIDEQKIYSWTKTKPAFTFYCQEKDRLERIICIYGNVNKYYFKLKHIPEKNYYYRTSSLKDKLNILLKCI